MVIDAAGDHVKDGQMIHAFPLCCAFNIRDARTQINKMVLTSSEKESCYGLKALAALEEKFYSQWRPEKLRQDREHLQNTPAIHW